MTPLRLSSICAVFAAALSACGSGESIESALPEMPSAAEKIQSEPVEAPAPGPVVRLKEFISRSFHVRKKWGSMEGPMHTQKLVLTQPERPEILWITGYRASVIAAEGDAAVPQEYMCHNNLDFDSSAHGKIFGWSQDALARNRVFTISQGQFDLALPEGFGIPIRSDEPLQITTQVLNHNHENPDLNVRHEIQINYSRDVDLELPLKPLLQHGVFVLASLEETEAYFGVKDPHADQEGSSCALGEVPEHIGGMSPLYTDGFGRRFTGHWVVKPGRETRHTLVTEQLNLTYDTRIHFIGVHLHPFAETLELRDMTTGESLWTAHASGPASGVGLTEVDYYSSEEGIPLYKDHEYELISVYDNDSGVEQDAMATLFLYLYDPEGEKGVESIRRLRGWASEAI
jgi:hypothetical protein